MTTPYPFDRFVGLTGSVQGKKINGSTASISLTSSASTISSLQPAPEEVENKTRCPALMDMSNIDSPPPRVVKDAVMCPLE
jgi:hypothetical protein